MTGIILNNEINVTSVRGGVEGSRRCCWASCSGHGWYTVVQG